MNGWEEWGRHVLKELDRHGKKLDGLCRDVSALKVKSGVWGLVGGMIPVGLALAYIVVRWGL